MAPFLIEQGRGAREQSNRMNAVTTNRCAADATE
jgi:hypothetical protein